MTLKAQDVGSLRRSLVAQRGRWREASFVAGLSVGDEWAALATHDACVRWRVGKTSAAVAELLRNPNVLKAAFADANGLECPVVNLAVISDDRSETAEADASEAFRLFVSRRRAFRRLDDRQTDDRDERRRAAPAKTKRRRHPRESPTRSTTTRTSPSVSFAAADKEEEEEEATTCLVGEVRVFFV
mmetsp:Transcript_26177/g.80527  ORF Transcript_26177/g.80527 Transcript_26177/m.80527 type:complete len:186 (+) Transcript_26177:60-617(+)|eukprot:CAMPEP_0198652634 /NCGR_PEP_ID=MMETSP1467-20131203/6526_1 /TAXON_ID=1462469 /ORGANISM="unid. sp., Strain CCMP2135" /LENGTH=185 /DNA_ID=CAMNT_0044388567 /DNA_START=8 /DNA_END=565 /DNA_ORIENTATION=+